MIEEFIDIMGIKFFIVWVIAIISYILLMSYFMFPRIYAELNEMYWVIYVKMKNRKTRKNWEARDV